MTELPLHWACDHCRRRACTWCLSSDDAQAIADRATEAHAIAQPDCHTEHGAAGLRIAVTRTPQAALWEM